VEKKVTTTIGTPKIDTRPEQAYIGIRTIAPFSGMSKVVTRISKEMNAWAKAHDVTPTGPPFLRFHVIDMRGEMDLSWGIPVGQALPADERVAPGILPAGRFASLIFSGSGLAGNKALIEWVRGNGMKFDRWDTEQGDNFRCRYEAYLTDPKVEPRKTRWQVEVAIKLADG
jgi:effector-binding domain-containing protein